MSHEIISKSNNNHKVAIFISNLDEHFEEILEFMSAEIKSNYYYLIDFDSNENWEKTINKYPCLIHFGSRYIKV
jgi:hypothetical protein